MKKFFTHIHLHTEYSLLDGAIKIEELPKIIKKKGMNAVAITDHGAMYGIPSFYKACLKENIKPIIGCEVYVAKNRFIKESNKEDCRYHLILLAENNIGYYNLINIVSKSFLEGFYYKPRVDEELLKQYSEGIIATSACVFGEISTKIRQDDLNGAIDVATNYKKIFGEKNFFIEIQDHHLEYEKLLNKNLIEIARICNLPIVAANDAHYLNKEDSYSHEILMCIQTGKTINDSNKIKFPNNEFYVKSSDEMNDIFKNLPDALENTELIKNRCNVELSFLGSHLPNYKVPKGYTLQNYLKKICLDGVKIKYGIITEKIKERLNYELNVINKMNYPGYFLIVWDMIAFAKKNSIFVGPGRGSAAGSIVAYVLDITKIDPLKYDLIFERFLNPERISLPDIDTDFCYVRRGEVIEYLINKYGKDHVAQIITFGTMAARAVIRDVGRALGISLNEVDKIAKLIPNEIKITLKKAIKNSIELKNICKTKTEIKNLILIAMKLEGMPRHTSTHAAAIVITPNPVNNYLPIKIENHEYLTTQFSMNTVEEIGLLKMDLLGLRTLTVIGETIEKIKMNRNIYFNIDEISLENKKTYDLLCSGFTCGIFQLESQGMQNIICQLKPDILGDIIALVALYRPGPIGSGMIDDFIKRKHKNNIISYVHPMLEPILKDTYGVILYQEQVMRIASKLGGFTLAEADNLRKAMGKKIPEILEKNRKGFIEGCLKNKIDINKAEEIFKLIEYFAGYGFNKSHSTAYAILAYQTAYLKANYPVEFMSSLLSSVILHPNKIKQYIMECKRMGICVLPPDINESKEGFSVNKNTIRFGFGAIKNIGSAAIDSIINARKKGNFIDIEDFCKRINIRIIGKKIIEQLILSGTFSSFNITRKALISILDDVVETAQRFKKENESNQISLFEIDKTIEDKKIKPLKINEEYSLKEFLQKEYQVLGFYISAHPLEEYPEILKGNQFLRFSEITEKLDKETVIFRGVINKFKEKITKNNNTIAIFTIEDETDNVDGIIFSNNYFKMNKELLKDGITIIGKGSLQITERDRKIILNEIISPEDYLKNNSFLEFENLKYKKENKFNSEEKIQKIYINLENADNLILEKLKKKLLYHKGNNPVILIINEKYIELGKEYYIKNNTEILNLLEFFGKVSVK